MNWARLFTHPSTCFSVAKCYNTNSKYLYNHSLTATTVTTRWSKPQICFCSDIYKAAKYYEWRELNIAEKSSGSSCRCNRFGKCRSCACVKASRCCTNCLPSRLGHCRNAPDIAVVTSHATTPPPAPATLYLRYRHPPVLPPTTGLPDQPLLQSQESLPSFKKSSEPISQRHKQLVFHAGRQWTNPHIAATNLFGHSGDFQYQRD